MSFHPTMPYETGELHKSERELPKEGEPFAFTPENRKRIEDLAAHYPPDRRRSALIPALHIVQQQQGYVSASAMREAATIIGCERIASCAGPAPPPLSYCRDRGGPMQPHS